MIVVAAAAGALLLWALVRLLRPNRSPFSNIPGHPAKSWLSGHLKDISVPGATGFLRMLEKTYGAVSRIKGPLGADWLYLYDPAAVHALITADAATYDELELFIHANDYFLGPSFIGVVGETHKKQRKMLHPVFGAKHMRDLLPHFYDVSKELVAALERHVVDGSADTNILGWTGHAALELIGRAGIGYSFGLLSERSEEDPFATAAKNFLPLFFSPIALVHHVLISLTRQMGIPGVARWLVEHSQNRSMQELRDTTQLLHDKSIGLIERQKEAVAKGEMRSGKDLMSVLLRANSDAAKGDKLPDDQLVAQVSGLLLAATDTTSGVIARILHQLSERPDVQTKLRREVLEARVEEGISYDALMSLPYLDAVCKETLRVFPPAPLGFRKAFRDTVLPFSQPVTGIDGSPISSVSVPKGSIAVISFSACNRNPALWGPDADEWKPERWLSPLPRAVEETAIPGVYANLMSFSGGQRSCIGFTFAVLEIKVVLAHLLANFTFSPSAEKPIVWNHSGIVYPSVELGSSKPEMWLRVGKYESA
ncbi:cytochrome P450 [Trametes polyzona]|nr:cytochrome P450 [Trametes polyzona]